MATNTGDQPARQQDNDVLFTINPFEETHNIIAYNLEQLLKATGMKRKDLARILDVSQATVSTWMTSSDSETKGKDSPPSITTPPITTLKQIRDRFNISIDDFTSKRLELYEHGSFSKIAPTEVRKYQWYKGTYFCYYFDTSARKGRDNKPDYQSLCYGLLHIYEVASPISGSDFKVIAVLGLKSHEKALEIYEYLEHFHCPGDVNRLLNNYEKFELDSRRFPHTHFSRYFGDLEISDLQVLMNLKCSEKDSAFLIFNRPFGHNLTYYGGIGTINSVSRGSDSCPCIQYIGLSKAPLTTSPEEISHNLLLKMPRIKAPEETEQLITLCKNLLEGQHGTNEKDSFYKLTDAQVYLTMKAQLEAKLEKVIQHNLFRCARVSRQDDDDWYHFIKPYVEAVLFTEAGGEQYGYYEES